MNLYTKLFRCCISDLNNFILAIRLSIIILIMCIVQANGATYGQQVTINHKNITIHQIFKTIKTQTGYDVIWRSDQLDANIRLDANFSSSSLIQVINKCILGKGLSFEFQDKSIVIKKVSDYNNRIFPLQDSTVFKGKVTDENGRAMAGVTVRITGSSRATFTSSSGTFSIYGPLRGSLELTYIGYMAQQITLNDKKKSEVIVVKMTPGNNNLGEVNIVSNGYQDIARERSTGSFEVITKEQLQHSSDPDLIKRLEGITTSLDFRNDLTPINSASTSVDISGRLISSSLGNLTIRGKNTLNTTNLDPFQQSGTVLVVIDGVPTPYSVDNVNPNDIESITILKDAAAASIWGSRAANGVIVIKTKKGSYNKPLSISFNSNFNVTEKLNLFYKNKMTTSEYIDAQSILFRSSNTSIALPSLSQAQSFISPVAEILGSQKRGEITAAQANAQLDALRGNDIRRDFEKYVLRDAFVQSYSLGLDGGSKNIAYRISAAYDDTKNNSIASSSNRLVFNYNTSLHIIKNLELNTNVTYSQRKNHDQSYDGPILTTNIGNPYFLYSRLVDDQGKALSIPYKYQPSFINLLSSTYGSKIQDLTFTPLNNINDGYSNTIARTLSFNLNGSYKLNSFLSANVVYNYSKGDNSGVVLDRQNSFFMRDLITTFTTNSGTQQIPQGARLNNTTIVSNYQSIRGQLNVNKNWGTKHALNAILGTELTDGYSLAKNNLYYGYSEGALTTNNQLNYSSNLPFLFRNSNSQTQGRIPYFGGNFVDSRIRTASSFANAAYTYNNRYTLSGSIRRDLSSDFGVSTNKGGTPFFSLGGSWNIANEDFYRLSWLPKLQLRTTFGYNGNVNNIVSALPIITYAQGVQDNGLLSASTGSDATNNQLRPEKTAVLNFGLDFGFKNNKISGSVEYYDKRTTDLIAGNMADPTLGYNYLTYNTASLHGRGADFTLNSQNLQTGLFSWSSNFLFSYNRVVVAQLYTSAAKTAGQVVTGTPTYNQGADLSRLYAFRWAGLDHVTGSPMGYRNGQVVVVNNGTTYASISTQPISSARYFGSAVPVYYGAFRNTFSYGLFSLSANLLYKLGYYFRRPAGDVVSYSKLFNSTNQAVQGAEYSQRWQKPGDETRTNVPSMIYPADNFRDQFYQYSEINVQKADHIRLQEVNLSYSLSKKNWFIKNPRIYANITNLGIIWRANKLGLDPDINDYPNPRTYSFGFSANF